MGRLRNVSKRVDKLPAKKDTSKSINAYRATRLWNQVVNGFKRFMPLKSHRVRFQTYENCFKREDAQKWLVDFINQSELLRPITTEKAAVLVTKFVEMNIIEQVCCTKSWLRSPTILYKFTSVNECRVEKLRALRYYSRTPLKGTPEVELQAPPKPKRKLTPEPLYVEGKENVLIYPNSPRLLHNKGMSSCKATQSKIEPTRQLLCTPCKRRHSLKQVFSSTPKDKHAPPAPSTLLNIDNIHDSPYIRALASIKKSQNIARKLTNKAAVKRIGNKGPLKKDLVAKKRNSVIEHIIDEFDELIEAIDNNITN